MLKDYSGKGAFHMQKHSFYNTSFFKILYLDIFGFLWYGLNIFPNGILVLSRKNTKFYFWQFQANNLRNRAKYRGSTSSQIRVTKQNKRWLVDEFDTVSSCLKDHMIWCNFHSNLRQTKSLGFLLTFYLTMIFLQAFH